MNRPSGGAATPPSAATDRLPHWTGWLPAAGLLAVAAAGYGCALRLIDVKPYSNYQHYYSWSWLVAGESFAIWGVAAQALIVAVVVWRIRGRLRGTLDALPVRAWLLLVCGVGFSLAVPAVSLPYVAAEVLIAGAIALVAACNLILFALLLPAGALAGARSWIDARVTLAPGATPPRAWDRRLPAAVALWVTLLAATTSGVVTERVPHIDDGVSNLFQAKYFAAGYLTLPPPPEAEAFRVDQVLIEPDRWYGYAFPGWPAVLALGVLAGAPWLVNPVLGGILVLLAHAWIRRRLDRGTANATVLLLAASPWLIFMSAEFMGQPLAAVLVLLALLSFDRAVARTRGWGLWAMLAGVSTGALMLTRPMDGALTIAAVGITTAIDRRLFTAWPAVLIAGVMTASLAALQLPYNQAVTGRADYPPHLAWSDYRWGPGVDRLGFGADIGIREWPNLDPLPGHGLPDIVLNMNKNLFMTNVDLFGWAPGSLVLIWIAVGLARWRRDDAPVLALVAMFTAGYNIYWFSGGPDLGARYWYPLLVPFSVLTVRGAQMLGARLEVRHAHAWPSHRITATLAAASLSALIVMIPWRAGTKHYQYRGVTGQVRTLAASQGFAHALVFVRGPAGRDYQSAFNLNPPTLDDPQTIYAVDAGPASRAAVVRRFPDRPVWVIRRDEPGPDVDAPFEVFAGPLAPGTVPP